MAKHITGDDRPQRWNSLDRQGVRCDGNNRTCVNRAVERYEVWRLSAVDGTRVSDTTEFVQSCGHHRTQFLRVATLEVASRADLRQATTPGNPNG